MNSRVSLTIPETAEALGISRARVYEVLRTGELKSFHLGKRHLVSVESLQTYIKSLESAELLSREVSG